MLNLTIDSKTKAIRCSVHLLGETEPIEIEIARYRLEPNAIVIEEIRVSREWMNRIAAELVLGKPIPLEGMLAKAAPLIL